MPTLKPAATCPPFELSGESSNATDAFHHANSPHRPIPNPSNDLPQTSFGRLITKALSKWRGNALCP
jgi:hypothetical protein